MPASQASLTAPFRPSGEAAFSDDRVVALQDQVLDLRRLLGHLVLGGGEGVGGGDGAVGDGGSRDLLPAFQHRLPPGVAGIVVGQRDLLAGGVGRCRKAGADDGGRQEDGREGSGHGSLPKVGFVCVLAARALE